LSDLKSFSVLSKATRLDFLMMLNGLLLIAFTILSMSCSSPTMRYLGYRISPDRVPAEGEWAVSAKGISGPTVILLDRYGIPHIQANRETDLYYAFGYVQARDRRFQMETLRLLASGRLRELVGNENKSSVTERLEIFSRMLGLNQDAEKIMKSANPEDIAMMEAFSAGVNAATKNEPSPFEFRILNYKPEPWKPMDSAVIMAMISFGLCKNWEHELGRLELIVYQLKTGSTIERALKIWRPRFDLPPHIIGEKPDKDPFADIRPVAPELAEYLISAYSSKSDLHFQSDLNIKAEDDSVWSLFFKGGSASNNWAVSGKWTGTGKAAFSCDPHMPHQLPPLGYLAHLQCTGCEGGDYEVIGGGFVGLPALPFATNGNVAWGPTSNWADVTDLYVEKPVQGKPGYYHFKSDQEPFEIRKEEFKIRKRDGSFAVETRTVRSTRHGVVINDFVDRLGPDFPIVTLKRSSEKGKAISALRNLYRSKDVSEARIALNDFAAMVGHWALADSKGSIAYCGPMYLPRRASHLGTIPVPGWTGAYEWENYIPIEQLPSIQDPESGFLGSANNQVIQPESQGYPLNFEGDVSHRYARLVQILSKGSNGKPIVEQMRELQTDGVDLGFSEVLPVFSKALGPLKNDNDPRVAKAAQKLLSWDGQYRPDSIEPALFHSLCAFLIKQTLEDEVAPATLEFYLSYFNIEPFVFSIFDDPTNPAWDDRRTSKVETSDEVIRKAFKTVVDALSKRYGKDMTEWTWNKTAPFELEHPFGAKKALGAYVNRGPYPSKGAGNTLYKQQFLRKELSRFPIKYGSVLRMIVDFNDIPGSQMCVPGGQSGRPSSRHYDDMLPDCLDAYGVFMEMDFDKIQQNAVGKIVLIP